MSARSEHFAAEGLDQKQRTDELPGCFPQGPQDALLFVSFVGVSGQSDYVRMPVEVVDGDLDVTLVKRHVVVDEEDELSFCLFDPDVSGLGCGADWVAADLDVQVAMALGGALRLLDVSLIHDDDLIEATAKLADGRETPRQILGAIQGGDDEGALCHAAPRCVFFKRLTCWSCHWIFPASALMTLQLPLMCSLVIFAVAYGQVPVARCAVPAMGRGCGKSIVLRR